MALADQPRIIGLALALSWRRLRRYLPLPGAGRLALTASAPERLVIAPQDLGTADPTVAEDIYSGVFHFAGQSVELAGDSPFRTLPPSPEWASELHSFRWLRHLGAAGDALSATNAQALVRDWMGLHPRPRNHPAWDTRIAAERLIAWLCHSVPILENADVGFYRQFLKSIGQHIRHLRRAASDAPDGMPRLIARIALAYASVSVSGAPSQPQAGSPELDAELDRQILPDGGHISRNAAHLPEILALLLPLRQAYARLGVAPSAELISAIDRMLPALRFHRLGDGGFARFNGVSVTPHDLVATVLRYDDTRGEASEDAAYSGYQRMALGDTVVIMDTGRPPSGELSRQAHAGCLSFEMSSGRSPLIVNCGAPAVLAGANRDSLIAARSTAAHSTATVNDTSSCRFHLHGLVGRYLDDRIIAGPQEVTAERPEEEEGKAVRASHDGYVRAFDIVHERRLHLSAQGTTLSGTDRFFGARGAAPRHSTRDKAVIRFHLHPSVNYRKSLDPHAVLLWTADGRRWKFSCADLESILDESIFFAVPGRPRRTVQIVLSARIAENPQIDWSIERQ